jgi:phage baseplate assembly protein W
MNDEYYTLPIPFRKIIERKEITKCDLQTSVAQKIHLTLISFFGESRYDRDFGCMIWEYDFDNIYNLNAWKDKVTSSIVDTLSQHERRLNNIQVNVDVQQEETGNDQLTAIKAIRKRLDVKVTGNLQKTNELFVFSEPIYVNPISLD